MTGRIQQTKQALLELGLEDWIAIPETFDTPEVREAVQNEDATLAVRAALSELVADGRVRVYRGRWDADPSPVPTSHALQLLTQERWYTFHPDKPSEDRLYFVNVENIREP